MRMRNWAVAGVAACAIAVAGGGAVLAQSGDEGGDSFLDRVAQKLGVQSEDLQDAIRDTRNEDIDAAVADGRLTQEQADRLKEKLDSIGEGDFEHGSGLGPFGPGPFGGPLPIPPGDFEFHGKPFGPRGDGPGFHFGFGFGLPESIDDLASFLGISTDQLREELAADGATLATVAEAHGKSRDELKDFIAGHIQERLDQAVADGNLTQEMADEIREKLDDGLEAMIDGRFGVGGHGFHFEFRHRQDGAPVPDEQNGNDTPAAPQSGARGGAGRS